MCCCAVFNHAAPIMMFSPPHALALSFLLKENLHCFLMLKWKSVKIQKNQYPLENQTAYIHPTSSVFWSSTPPGLVTTLCRNEVKVGTANL